MKEEQIAVKVKLTNADEVIEKLEQIKKLLDDIKDTKIEISLE